MPADVQAPNGASPSEGTVLHKGLDMFTSKFIWLSMISYSHYGNDDVIQDGRRNLEKSQGTLSGKIDNCTCLWITVRCSYKAINSPWILTTELP